MEDTTRLTHEQAVKLFIQRDYSDGTAVKFQERFPRELEGKVKIFFFVFIIDDEHFAFRLIQVNLWIFFNISMKSLLKLNQFHVEHLLRIVVLV